jgi:hypothetical protein
MDQEGVPHTEGGSCIRVPTRTAKMEIQAKIVDHGFAAGLTFMAKQNP